MGPPVPHPHRDQRDAVCGAHRATISSRTVSSADFARGDISSWELPQSPPMAEAPYPPQYLRGARSGGGTSRARQADLPTPEIIVNRAAVAGCVAVAACVAVAVGVPVAATADVRHGRRSRRPRIRPHSLSPVRGAAGPTDADR